MESRKVITSASSIGNQPPAYCDVQKACKKKVCHDHDRTVFMFHSIFVHLMAKGAVLFGTSILYEITSELHCRGTVLRKQLSDKNS